MLYQIILRMKGFDQFLVFHISILHFLLEENNCGNQYDIDDEENKIHVVVIRIRMPGLVVPKPDHIMNRIKKKQTRKTQKQIQDQKFSLPEMKGCHGDNAEHQQRDP